MRGLFTLKVRSTPTPEAMRRLQQAVLRHQVGRLQDDATLLFVEWLTGEAENILP